MLFSEDAPALEHLLHKHFVTMQMNKVNFRKEFFRVDLAHIRAEIESLGLSVQWTMTAEAREYRETLAIEKTLENDPTKRDAWIKRQLELDAANNNFANTDGSDAVESEEGSGQVTEGALAD